MEEEIESLKKEISILDEKIVFREKQNEKYRNRLNELIIDNTNRFKEQARTTSIAFQRNSLNKKKEMLTREIEIFKRDIDDVILSLQENCKQLNNVLIQTKITLSCVQKASDETVVRKKTEKTEYAIKRIRQQLLKTVAKIAHLNETSLFNLSLNDVTSNYKEWTKKFTPEQTEVILNYLHHLVRVFVLYFQIPLRYQIKQDSGVIHDPVTKSDMKLFEHNYRLFKNENTLQKSLECFNNVIQCIYSKVDSQVFAKLEPLKCLTGIVEHKPQTPLAPPTQAKQQNADTTKESSVLSMSTQDLFNLSQKSFTSANLTKKPQK